MSTPKQVKALILNSSTDRYGVSLSWAIQETNVDSYLVYRGGASVFSESDGPYNVQPTDTLILSVRGGQQQTILMSGVTSGAATALEVVTAINSQVSGAQAQVSVNSPNRFLVRCLGSNNESRRLDVVGGTARSALSLPTGKYWSRQATNYQLITTTSNPTNTFEDRDGTENDWYYVQARNTTGPFNPGITQIDGQESLKKTLWRHYDNPSSRIAIFGTIYDASGYPIGNSEVRIAAPMDKIPSLNKRLRSSTFGVSEEAAKVYTDQDGYFEIEVLADTDIRLIIPAINYDHEVKTTTESVDFTSLRVTTYDILWDDYWVP